MEERAAILECQKTAEEQVGGSEALSTVLEGLGSAAEMLVN